MVTLVYVQDSRAWHVTKQPSHTQKSRLTAIAAASPPHAQSTASLPTNALSRALLLVSTAPWGDDRANFLCRGTNSRLASLLPLHSSRSQVKPQHVSPRAQSQARNMDIGKWAVNKPDSAGAGVRPEVQSTKVTLLPPCIQEPEVRQQLQAAQSLCGDPRAAAHAQTLQPAAGPARQRGRDRLSCSWGAAGDNWLRLQTVQTLHKTVERCQTSQSDMGLPAVKVQATSRSPYVRSSSRASPNLVRDTFKACSALLRPLAAMTVYDMLQQAQQTGILKICRAAGMLHAAAKWGQLAGILEFQAAEQQGLCRGGRLSRLAL